MVEGAVRDVVLLRPGRDHATGDTESRVVVRAGRVARRQHGRHVVGLHRRLGGHVVVPAAVLVVDPDQSRLVPCRPAHHRIDEECGIPLAHRDVTVLLREVAVGVDQAEGRKAPRRGVAKNSVMWTAFVRLFKNTGSNSAQVGRSA